jgi:cyanophycin synthetase
MFCGFGRTRSTGKDGVYNVVFSYMEEKAGVYTAKAAVRIAEALIAGNEYNLPKTFRTCVRSAKKNASDQAQAVL